MKRFENITLYFCEHDIVAEVNIDKLHVKLSPQIVIVAVDLLEQR